MRPFAIAGIQMKSVSGSFQCGNDEAENRYYNESLSLDRDDYV